MSFTYTSKDAYNGCLSLFSDSEREHRGGFENTFSKIKITGGVKKIPNGFEFKISRITSAQCSRHPLLGTLIDDRFEETGAEVPTSYPRFDGVSDYIIPSTAYAKIVLTTDTSLFPAQQQRYTVTLQISNFDFADLAAWPPLSRPSLNGKQISTSGDSCCVSLGESWSLCDTHSEAGSETGGEWELISMEAIGEELQQMNILHDLQSSAQARPETKDRPPVRLLFSYADAVKKDAPNLSSQEVGFSHTPKRKHSDQKWEPVFAVKHVSRLDRADLIPPFMQEGYYDYGFDDDVYDTGAYEDVKSFGASARTNMLVANVAYSKTKEMGVISVGSRFKSVK